MYALLTPDAGKRDRSARGRLPAAAARRPPSKAATSGLKTAAEIDDLQRKIQLLSDAAQQTIDWPLLHTLFDRPAPATAPCTVPPPRRAHCRGTGTPRSALPTPRRWRHCGKTARSCAFSARWRDTALPDNIGGLYLPGGYPELYAARLAANAPLRAAVKSAVQGGLPTVAECGGFLYLGRTLQDADGTPHPMAGVLPGQGFKVGRLVRFGYARLTARADSMLFRAGETLPVHEFHHWDSTENGDAFTAAKGKRAAVGVRLCQCTSLRGFSASLLGRYAAAEALCGCSRTLYKGNIMTENELKNLLAAVTPPDEAARAAAHAHWAALAKPLGGLGRLEAMVEDAAALTGDPVPDVSRRAVLVLCADNGVVAQGVSQTDASRDPRRARKP